MLSKDHSICSGTKEKELAALSQALIFFKETGVGWGSLYWLIIKFGDLCSLIMSYADIILKSVLTSLGKAEIDSMTLTYQG